MHFTIFIVVTLLSVLGVRAIPQPQADSTATSSAPETSPTIAYSLISARSASPIHLQGISAAGFRLWVGGSTAAYCPTSSGGACPPGNVTAFLGMCAMDVVVPGGQQLYVTPSGELGYAQAHSISLPEGAHVCPFAYTRPAGSSFGYIGLDPLVAFGAGGLMACPTDSGYYQVFASMRNATVPKGNISECLGFSAIAVDFADGFAAWQYI